jgi:hypothetical protein
VCNYPLHSMIKPQEARRIYKLGGNKGRLETLILFGSSMQPIAFVANEYCL